MAIDRSSNQTQRADAQALADVQLQTQADARGAKTSHAKHRGNYGGNHYEAHETRSHRPKLRIPLKPRPQPKRRRARSTLDSEMDDTSMELDDRDAGDDREKPFDPTSQLFQHANREQQHSGGGSQSDDSGGSQGGARSLGSLFTPAQKPTEAPHDQPIKLKAKVGPRREQHDTGGRLLGMSMRGAERLFGATRYAGPDIITEHVAAVAQLVLTAARSGTGFAAAAPSMMRVAMTAGVAALERLPQTVTCSLTISDVKSLLVHTKDVCWEGKPLPRNAPETTGNALALLPLVALNTTRPRVPTAKTSAEDLQKMSLNIRGI